MSVRFRGTAAGAATAGVIVLGALTAPAATAAPAVDAISYGSSHSASTLPVALAAPQWAPVASAAIHPGVNTTTAGGGTCTSNFVFTAGGRVFIGQAAHCAGTGAATETDGCHSGTEPVGTPVAIKGDDGRERSGTLAYSSWVTMQQRGETDPDTCAFNDFALVELDPADTADVNPSIPFFGGPTGVDSDGLRVGEQVYTYGNSPLRLGVGALGPKVGVTATEQGGGRGHEVYTISPGIPGDSGSAFLDGSGRAVGILSTLNLAPLPVSNGVADLARALAYADANGGLGDIALVPGTKKFTTTPLGVPDTALAGPAGPPIGQA